ncbi:MAG: hypothetical protein ABSG65_29020 [Bryobacteraceae bacterium]
MTPVSFNSAVQENYAPVYSQKVAPQADPASGSGASQPDRADAVQLSPAALREVALTGRVAANGDLGNLTSTQTQQLYGQISSIQSQVAADTQADGGTLSPSDAQTIQQSQNQLSGTIYSDAHNGAAPPSDPIATQAAGRDAVQAGRIALNQQAGRLNGGQATQLGSQLSTIQQQIATDEQANGGTLSSTDAQAINQLQNQFSQQIEQTARSITTPNLPVVNPA